MFQVRGQFDVRIDAKGRLPLPARLRERLLDSGDPRLVLAAWDGGLSGFSADRWRRMEARFAGVSLFDRKSRAFLLSFVAGACEVEPDAQGRILVPPALRRQAALRSRCVVLSYLGLMEIWDADRWAARQIAATQELEAGGGPPGMEGLFALDDGGADL
jgi:MraZ protein